MRIISQHNELCNVVVIREYLLAEGLGSQCTNTNLIEVLVELCELAYCEGKQKGAADYRKHLRIVADDLIEELKK